MVVQEMVVLQTLAALHLVDHRVHVPEIVHHVPEIVHHVPEIVHHVPEIEQSRVQVAAVAMIAPVQHAMSQMVAQSVIHADSVLLLWSAILHAFAQEFLSQIFLSMSREKS
jgi:hypothetical protein